MARYAAMGCLVDQMGYFELIVRDLGITICVFQWFDGIELIFQGKHLGPSPISAEKNIEQDTCYGDGKDGQ